MKDYNKQGIDFSQYTILIVDDIPSNVMLVEVMLSPYKFNILKATGGREALEMAVSCRPNIILLDIMMPDMDGFEVTRRLRENKEIPYIPIIIMSALNSESDVSRCFSLGADGFIVKPIIRENLLTSVMVHISQQEAQKNTESGSKRSDGMVMDKVMMCGAYMFCTQSPLLTGVLKALLVCLPFSLVDDSLFAVLSSSDMKREDEENIRNGILAWAVRQIYGKTLELKELDAVEPLFGIIKSLKPVTQERGISWDVEKRTGIRIRTDAEYYRSVLNGLLACSCRISAGGSVRVRMDVNNNGLVFSVQGRCIGGRDSEIAFSQTLIKEIAVKLGGSLTVEYPEWESFSFQFMM